MHEITRTSRRAGVFAGLLAAFVLVHHAGHAFADEPQPRWYKGNTHTHSLWSDGNDFPEMIIDWYKQNGYDFLALSDHNILAEGEKWMAVSAIQKRVRGPQRDVVARYVARFGEDWVETREHDGESQVRLKTLAEFRPLFEEPGRFLLIQAEEITDRYERKPVHLNALNLQKLIPPQGGSSVRDTMRRNLLAGIRHEQKIGEPVLVHLNHPNFGWGITAEDMAHVLEEDFFEVYNGHPGVRHFGDDYRPGDERLWDIANTIRLGELGAPPLYGVATDDSHHYHGGPVSSGKGWIMVHADELTPAAIITAMRRGAFYGSSGITLRDVRFDPDAGTLTIAIDPEPGETYTTTFYGTEVGYDRTTRPRVDGEGNQLDATRQYAPEVGAELAKVTGTTAVYRLTGRELYVRATVRSDQPPVNPSYENEVKRAWTQPVGWTRHVDDMGVSRLDAREPYAPRP